eukprot:IDg4694t1
MRVWKRNWRQEYYLTCPRDETLGRQLQESKRPHSGNMESDENHLRDEGVACINVAPPPPLTSLLSAGDMLEGMCKEQSLSLPLRRKS